MANINTTISLADPTELTDEYFLIIEQVEPEGTLVEEEDAAKLVDDIYKTSICDESYEIPICGGSITANARPDEPTEEEVQEAVEELGIPDCEDADGSFTAQVKIYRSHQEEDYNLVIEGGEETLRVVVQEPKTITLNVKLQNSVEIGFPYIGNVQAVWLGEVYNSLGNITPPIITISGNVLSWTGDTTGTITISFNTIYDLIDIYAYPPDEDEDGNYVDLLAFYHYEVYTETIEEIVTDDNLTAAELNQLCDEWGKVVPVFPPGPTKCYTLQTIQTRCICSGSVEDSYDIRNPVTCPEGQTEGGQVGPRTTSTSFIDCGESDRVNDPEYYEDNCCEPPPFPLPYCKVAVNTTPSGGTLSKNDIDHYTALYGSAVRFIPVTPDEGYCGLHSTIQDVDAINCCDEVDPIIIDVDNTDWEIGWPGTADLYAEGGEAPYTWTANGGYIFSNGLNWQVTAYPSNRIYTDDLVVCSDAHIRLEDHCSNVMFNIEQTIASKEIKFYDDMLVAPDTETPISLELSTVGPYQWAGGGDVQWKYSETTGPANILISSPDFCGTSANVTATDACGNIASSPVRSTDGVWVAYPFDECDCEATSGDVTYSGGSGPGGDIFPHYATVINGEHKCVYELLSGIPNNWSTVGCDTFTPPVCGMGPFPPLPLKFCSDYGSYTSQDGDCCRDNTNESVGVYAWIMYGSKTLGYYKWECP